MFYIGQCAWLLLQRGKTLAGVGSGLGAGAGWQVIILVSGQCQLWLPPLPLMMLITFRLEIFSLFNLKVLILFFFMIIVLVSI